MVFSVCVGVFLVLFLGVVLGLLLQRVMNTGKGSEPVGKLGSEQSHFYLSGFLKRDDQTLGVALTPLTSYRQHSERLIESYLRELALDPKRYTLIELRMRNEFAEITFSIDDRDGMAVLTDDAGISHASIPLPLKARNSSMQRRLAQRRAVGELPAMTMRRFWLLLERPLDFKSLKSGTITLVDGETIELQLVAISVSPHQ